MGGSGGCKRWAARSRRCMLGSMLSRRAARRSARSHSGRSARSGGARCAPRRRQVPQCRGPAGHALTVLLEGCLVLWVGVGLHRLPELLRGVSKQGVRRRRRAADCVCGQPACQARDGCGASGSQPAATRSAWPGCCAPGPAPARGRWGPAPPSLCRAPRRARCARGVRCSDAYGPGDRYEILG